MENGGNHLVLTFMIPVYFIESVNKLHNSVTRKKYSYNPKTHKRVCRTYSEIVMSPAARNAKAHYIRQLGIVVPKNRLPAVKWRALEITYGYYISSKTFNRRDYDNMTKIFQDCLAYYLGFDDSVIVTGHSYKRRIHPKNRRTKNEYIYVKIVNDTRSESELTVDEQSLFDQVGMKVEGIS